MKIVHKGDWLTVFVDEEQINHPKLQHIVRVAALVVEGCFQTGDEGQVDKLHNTLKTLARETVAWVKTQNP